MINIFIGYDKKEIPAYHVLSHSILERSSQPVSIIPLKLEQLKNIYFRNDIKATTEFSLTRFLVPYLSNYKGYSIFIDCDMLCKIDIIEIFKEIEKDPDQHVYVCKHEYESKFSIKATGKNENYPRKNWSSVMIFNNEKCLSLTPEYINSASASDLHRLIWADEKIGSLPLEYNWLVGEYNHNENAKILHYTLGTPCFQEYENCDHSEEWHKEHLKLTKNI